MLLCCFSSSHSNSKVHDSTDVYTTAFGMGSEVAKLSGQIETDEKTAVMGILERGGKVRTTVIPNRKKKVFLDSAEQGVVRPTNDGFDVRHLVFKPLITNDGPDFTCVHEDVFLRVAVTAVRAFVRDPLAASGLPARWHMESFPSGERLSILGTRATGR